MSDPLPAPPPRAVYTATIVRTPAMFGIAAWLSWVLALLEIGCVAASFSLGAGVGTFYALAAPLFAALLWGVALLAGLIGAVRYRDVKLYPHLALGGVFGGASLLATLFFCFMVLMSTAKNLPKPVAGIGASGQEPEPSLPPRAESGTALSTKVETKATAEARRLTGETSTLDGVKITKLNVQGAIVAELQWSADGEQLFLLDAEQVRQIRVRDWQQTRRVAVANGSSLALAKAGLVVATPKPRELLVIDSNTLDIRRRLDVPARRIAASPSNNWALVLCDGAELLDLESGKYRPVTSPQPDSIRLVAVSRDGLHYFTAGEAVHYYRLRLGELEHQGRSHQIPRERSPERPERLEISSDSQLVALSMPGQFESPGLSLDYQRKGTHWLDVTQLRSAVVTLDTPADCAATACDSAAQRFFAADSAGNIVEFNRQGLRQRTIQVGVGKLRQLLLHPSGRGMIALGNSLAWVEFPPPTTALTATLPTGTVPTIPPPTIPPTIPLPATDPPKAATGSNTKQWQGVLQVHDVPDSSGKLHRMRRVVPPSERKFSGTPFFIDKGERLLLLDVNWRMDAAAMTRVHKLSLPDFASVQQQDVPLSMVWHTVNSSEGMVLHCGRTGKIVCVSHDNLEPRDLPKLGVRKLVAGIGSPYLYVLAEQIRRVDLRDGRVEILPDAPLREAGAISGASSLDTIALSPDGARLLALTTTLPAKDSELWQFRIEDKLLVLDQTLAMKRTFAATMQGTSDGNWLVRGTYAKAQIVPSAELRTSAEFKLEKDQAIGFDAAAGQVYVAGDRKLEIYKLDGTLVDRLQMPFTEVGQVVPHPAGGRLLVTCAKEMYWIELGQK